MLQVLRWILVAILALAVAVILALWWAGFAPFPTEPALLASYQVADYCKMGDGNSWAMCSPGLKNPEPKGTSDYFRLFPNAERTKEYGEYAGWGIEGFNGCWNNACSDIWHEGFVLLQWKKYYDITVPHFGLGTAKWVVAMYSRHAEVGDGPWPETAFTTYGSCMYRKPADDSDEWYKCELIEPNLPWHVGRIEMTGLK